MPATGSSSAPTTACSFPAAGAIDEGVEISDSPYRLEPVSATFHGRDIFAPVAAHSRSASRSTGDAGRPGDLVELEPLRPRSDGATRIVHVVEVDGFGNLITDGELPARRSRVGGHDVVVGRTFGDAPPGGLVLYTDSAGDVALAVNGGSAAELLGVRAGDELRLT